MSKSDKKYKNAVCLSDGIAHTPHLDQFTGASSHQSTKGINSNWQFKNADLIVDWGNKRFEITSRLQSQTGIDVLSLEDGFVRSMGLGVNGSRAFSIVSDWTGIYYDARRPSDLENILEGKDPRSELLPNLKQRASQCIARIINSNISKYNHAPEIDLGNKVGKRILLVDQTARDLSISAGLASESSFIKMLEDAFQEDAEILIKTHPDVVAGKKAGYLGNRKYPDKVRLITEFSNPVHLIKQVDEVWVVTSQMGIEACMAGKKVRCYGAPFYAGWGITEDKQALSRRTQKRSLEEIFAAAYLLYSSYFDPETLELTELEVVLEHIERQKHYWAMNRGHFLCLGFDRWKHSYVRNYLRSDNNQIEFRSKLREEDIKADTQVIVWGNNISERCRQLAKSRSVNLITMEDGFIRSVNLGKYGTPPRSLVVDQRGIYFNPESSSDLEKILQETTFSEQQLEQAERVIQAITTNKISKYNVGKDKALQLNNADGKKVILVPGQVGIDASIAKGCDEVNSNMKLLQAVRSSNQNAYVLFKPHPDIVSGNIVESGDYSLFADQVEAEATIHACLNVANEVHTMTSLVGFEALLQELPVHTYGRPFYAGWGLTTDHSQVPMPKRTKRLTLQELVAGTLLAYPRYINPETGEFSTAERTLNALQRELQESGTPRLSGNLLARWWLKIRYGGFGIALSLLKR